MDMHTPDDGSPPVDLDTVRLLVPKAKSGSGDAKNRLLEQIQDYVHVMAKNKLPANLRGKFGTSDIVQQSLAQVIQRFDDFRGESPGQFYAWLRTIVANEARQLHREYNREKRDIRRERSVSMRESGSQVGFIPQDAQPTPGTNAIATERIQKLNDAIDRLSDNDAAVIRLRSLERLPFKEVAKRMGRSVGAVTKLWYRAILRLERELSPDDESIAE